MDESVDVPEGHDGEAPAAPAGDPFAQLSGVDEARGCIGARLDELGGTTVGKIEGVLADAVDGTPSWLVARLGRFGRRVAVPYDFVAPGVGHVWAPFDRGQIRAASELDPLDGLSVADERALAAHYGIAAGTGRLAALEDRDDGESGSSPI